MFVSMDWADMAEARDSSGYQLNYGTESEQYRFQRRGWRSMNELSHTTSCGLKADVNQSARAGCRSRRVDTIFVL